MPGRLPLPSVLKLLKGTYRKDRANKNEPQPPKPPSVLRCPKDLTGEARREWKQLARVLYKTGLLTALDRNALSMYCQLWEWWTDAARHLRDEGLTTTDEEGVTRKSIWARIEQMTFDHLLTLSHELGLTPASRTRIHAVAPDSSQPNPWAS